MGQEQFEYKRRIIKVEVVQPLFAEGWLWRVFINGRLFPNDRWRIFHKPEQALSHGITEAKVMIDIEERELLTDGVWLKV